MKVDFWQLSRDPVERVAALIAERVLSGDERLLIVSSDQQVLAAISRTLWDARPDAFLANGMAEAPHAARQPILLASSVDAANGASHVIFADGTWREPDGFDRVFLLFGDATIDAARAVWRSLDGQAELERSFFRQDEGKWVKIA